MTTKNTCLAVIFVAMLAITKKYDIDFTFEIDLTVNDYEWQQPGGCLTCSVHRYRFVCHNFRTAGIDSGLQITSVAVPMLFLLDVLSYWNKICDFYVFFLYQHSLVRMTYRSSHCESYVVPNPRIAILLPHYAYACYIRGHVTFCVDKE